MANSRGSLWRRWDLHVHTPESEGFKGSFSQLVDQIERADCDVVGINDYCSLDGYEALLSHLPAISKPLFPVVEFRMNNAFFSRSSPGATHINFHIIFDPLLPIGSLQSALKAIMANVGDGHSPIGSLSNRHSRKSCTVDFVDVCQKLEGNIQVRGHYFVWLPYDEYGGIDQLSPEDMSDQKRLLTNKADFMGSASQDEIDFFLWKNTKFPIEHYKEIFHRRRPCIKGSDSHDHEHNLGHLRSHAGERTNVHCWIKADTTFEGLRQVIADPEGRVFIGTIPPDLKRYADNQTKYIDSVRILPLPGTSPKPLWFNSVIPLNQGLVAIIGNKGSGKSALAEAVALAGQSHAPKQHYSFLEQKRFRKKPEEYANFYCVDLLWHSGNVSPPCTLSEEVKSTDHEYVHFLPQNYVETICTSLSTSQPSDFEIELRKVIFSHANPALRLRHATLDDALNARLAPIDARIEELREELSRINTRIVHLEDTARPSYRESLRADIEAKQLELALHDSSKPIWDKPVPLADKLTPDQLLLQTQIAELNKQIVLLQAQHDRNKSQSIGHASVLSELEVIVSKLRTLERTFLQIRSDLEVLLKDQDVQFDEILKLHIDFPKLENFVNDISGKLSAIEAQLDTGSPNSVVSTIITIQKQISAISQRMEEPQRLYQEYESALSNWNLTRASLLGSIEETGTLKYLQKRLEDLQGTREQWALQVAHRHSAAVALHELIWEKVNVHKQMYERIMDFIEKDELAKDVPVSFFVELSVEALSDGVLDFIGIMHLTYPETMLCFGYVQGTTNAA